MERDKELKNSWYSIVIRDPLRRNPAKLKQRAKRSRNLATCAVVVTSTHRLTPTADGVVSYTEVTRRKFVAAGSRCGTEGSRQRRPSITRPRQPRVLSSPLTSPSSDPDTLTAVCVIFFVLISPYLSRDILMQVDEDTVAFVTVNRPGVQSFRRCCRRRHG